MSNALKPAALWAQSNAEFSAWQILLTDAEGIITEVGAVWKKDAHYAWMGAGGPSVSLTLEDAARGKASSWMCFDDEDLYPTEEIAAEAQEEFGNIPFHVIT